MENELLRIVILPGKGSDIVEFLYKPLDIDFMWRSPKELRCPSDVSLLQPQPDGPFLDLYEGGWQDIFPAGGAPGQYKGIAYGLHDESCNLPWTCRIVVDSEDQVACELSIRLVRNPIVAQKRLMLKRGVPTLFVDERLINESDEDLDVMWGQHIVIGEPFLSADCRIDTPAGKVIVDNVPYNNRHRFPAGAEGNWPRLTTKTGEIVDLTHVEPRRLGTEDMLYLTELAEPWFALTDTVRKVSFVCRFSEPFRSIWYWQVFGGPAGYPWYGQTYMVGLEPWTGAPGLGLQEAVRRGVAIRLPRRGTLTTRFTAGVAVGLNSVSTVSVDGEAGGPRPSSVGSVAR